MKLFVTFFKVGLSPKAPGTFGTLAAVPLAFLLMNISSFVHMGFILVLTPLAIWACEKYEQQVGKHDLPEIVIDEVVGFLLTMVWLPVTWQSFVLGFVLFRLLDIFKPFPISVLDKKVPGGVGVMIDDIAAGLIANVFLQVLYTKTNWLGVQIITSG